MHKFLFEPIYNLSQIPWVREFASLLSNEITYALLGISLIWAIFYSTRKMYSFSLIFLTIISAWFTSNLIKVIARLPRPYVETGFRPVEMESGFSFPSSHATILFALAFAVSFLYPKYGKVLLFMAILVALSRVILGVHYPVDVLAGAGLGYLVSWFYIRIFKRI